VNALRLVRVHDLERRPFVVVQGRSLGMRSERIRNQQVVRSIRIAGSSFPQ